MPNTFPFLPILHASAALDAALFLSMTNRAAARNLAQAAVNAAAIDGNRPVGLAAAALLGALR